MSAIVVALTVGVLAVGLVVGMVVLSVLALAGLKAINAAHDGGSWYLSRRRALH